MAKNLFDVLITLFFFSILLFLGVAGCSIYSYLEPTITNSSSNLPNTPSSNAGINRSPIIAAQSSSFTQTPSIPAGTNTPGTEHVTNVVNIPTSVIPGTVTKDLLILVDEELGSSSISFTSVWILSPGDVIPKPLLDDPDYSFETPIWSNDGNWIAFRQRKASDLSSYQLGVIRRNGADKQIFQITFGAIGGLSWSADDRVLVFDDFTSLKTMYLDNGEVIDLFRYPESSYCETSQDISYKTWFKPSSKENLVLFASYSKNSDPKSELKLFYLDDKRQENILLPEGVLQNCDNGFTTTRPLEWSPDGTSFLVQFRGLSEEICWPQLWLYNLNEKDWTSVAHLPENSSSYLYNENGEINWSENGRWVAWSTSNGVLIFDTNGWKVVRRIDFNGFESLFIFPWLSDGNVNSILSINRIDFSAYPRNSMDIIGINPNGKPDADTVLLRIEADSRWIADGVFFTPLMWQP